MADLPTYEQATNQLPSYEDAVASNSTVAERAGQGVVGALTDNPVTGPIADWLFDQGPYKKVVSAFGQGAAEGYGLKEPPVDVSDFLRKQGIYNDWKDGKENILKSGIEAILRPQVLGLVNPLLEAGRAGQAALGGVNKGIEAFGSYVTGQAEQIQQAVPGPLGTALATPVGGLGEIIGATPGGFLPELHIPELAAARGDGIIGEDEGTFFGTKSPTAAQQAARSRALGELGPAQHGVDVHTVARANHPELFETWDDLTRQRDDLRDKLSNLAPDTQTVNPDWDFVAGKMNEWLKKVDFDETRLSKGRKQDVEEARDVLAETPEFVPSEEVAGPIRQQLSEIDRKMRDVAPDVAFAHREAGEQLGALYSPLERPTEPFEGLAPEVPPEAKPSPEAATEPVKGEIFKDVYDKLKKAGRGDAEAEASAHAIQEYYETRSDRFKSGRSAKDLYDSEAPDVVKANRQGRSVSRGKIELKSGKNLIKFLKNSDASTFVHEMGHQFLEDLAKDAADPDVKDQVRQDFETVRDWYNKNRRSPKGGQYVEWAPGEKIPGQAHEMWARGFERYLMEGVAPTKVLARVFQQFKNWLTKIYRTVDALQAPINDDIRDVYSRLLTRNPENVTVEDAAHVPTNEASDTEVAGQTEAPTDAPVSTTPKDQPKTASSTVSFNQSKYINPEGKINLENLTSDEDLRNFLSTYWEQNRNFFNARKGNLSTSDRLEMSDLLAESPRRMRANINKLSKLFVEDSIPVDVRFHALKEALLQNTQRLKDLSMRSDPVAFSDASILQNQLSAAFHGVRTTWGRLGLELQKGAGALSESEQINTLLQGSVGKTLEQVQRDMLRVSKLDTPKKIAGYMKASYGEMALEYFKNNLISGPLTHMSYLTGNELFALYRAVPETLFTAAAQGARELITGERTPVGERVYAGEALEGMYGWFFGKKDGVQAAWKAMQEGQTQPLPGEDLATTPFTATKAIPGALGTVARLPGERMVAPIHTYNRTVNYLSKRAQLIYRQARDEGLVPGSADFARRIAELKNDTPPPIVKAARDYATETALMGTAGEWTRRAQAWVTGEIDLPVLGRTQPLSFIDPFVHVSGNINKLSILERSPLGLFSKTIRDDLMGTNGKLAQSTAIGKLGTGSALWGTVGSLYFLGALNPGPNPDWKKANVDLYQKGLPNSFVIGDMSYAFDRLGVLGSNLAIAADVMQSLDIFQQAVQAGLKDNDLVKGLESGITEAGLHFVSGVWEHLTSEGLMSGLSNLVEAASDPGRYGKNFLIQMGTNFVPYSSGLRQITSQIDPVKRRFNDLTESVRSIIPGLSQDLEPRVDVFGADVPQKEFVGVYAQQIHDDEVTNFLVSKGWFPTPIPKNPKIMGVPLTPTQTTEYTRQAGILLRQQLEATFQLPGFYSMTPGQQHDLIKFDVENSRQIAQGQIISKYMGTGDTDIAVKAAQMQQDLLK